ncbi:MAG: thioredoxin family protein [Rhodospirillales bacterium]|nr:thioredoxin family protein [Rhodospirillales bacterium]
MLSSTAARRIVIAGILALLALVPVGVPAAIDAPARGTELVLFEAADCPWCARWHREIGPIYPRTEISALLPLRRVYLDRKVPEDLRHLPGVRFTPTFVATVDGREVGRIVGYPGDDLFWGLIEDIYARARVMAGARNAGDARGIENN